MKKTLSIALALCMILSVCMFSVHAEQAELVHISVLGFDNNPNGAGGFTNRENQVVWHEAKKLWNEAGLELDFECIVDSDQYKTTIQTRLASATEIPDLFYGGHTAVPDLLEMADMGMILKINDVLEYSAGPAKDFWYGGFGDRARLLISDTEGNFFWLPRIQLNQLNGTNAGTSIGMTIRLDWLNKLNLPVPTTLDEFTNAIRAFQENDMNGNGDKDEVLVEDASRFSCGINLWFGIPTCDDTAIGCNLTEDRVESAWYSPAIKEYFTYINQLVSEGLISPDFIGTDNSDSALLTSDQVAGEQYYPVGTYLEATMRAGNNPDAYLIGIYPIEAVEGVKPFYSEETPYLVYMRYCVSSSAQDKIESVAKLFDVLYGEKCSQLMRWGVEGTNYEVLPDGTNHRLNPGMSANQMGELGAAIFNNFLKFLLPDYNYNERAEEISRTVEAGWKEKGDYEYATIDYAPRTPNDNTGYYALGTAEENEIIAQYSTDLATASREIAANLALGVYSVDDIDQYIEELKAAGLDEVLAVRQAQFARAKGYQSYEAMTAAMFHN